MAALARRSRRLFFGVKRRGDFVAAKIRQVTYSTATTPILRVATYNIHKGVQGVGPARRLEIHNLLHAVEQFDADLVCLQEVRGSNRREQAKFAGWPAQGQAEFLAPEGYQAVYVSNATTRYGDHGNALLSRWPVLGHQQHDISDHKLEQRGVLHVQVQVKRPAHQPLADAGVLALAVHVSALDVLVLHVLVVHLGLIPASRHRQVEALLKLIARDIAPDAPVLVAGDFNDWGSHTRQAMAAQGLRACEAVQATFPSRLPLAQLDQVFARGLQPLAQQVPRGRIWQQMSDHLPLIADFAL
jgi:endonuclease/exonuclease/phosphatase family metal-dependent hydrolase